MSRKPALALCVVATLVVALAIAPAAGLGAGARGGVSARGPSVHQWPSSGHDPANTRQSPSRGSIAGHVKWSYRIPGTGTAAASGPIVDAFGNVYFTTTDNKLYALRSSGTLKWSIVVAGAGEAIWAPALDGAGDVILGGDALAAYGPTGVPLASFAVTGAVFGPPTIEESGTIYVGASDGLVRAINGFSGTFAAPVVAWSAPTSGAVAGPVAVGPDGTVFASSTDKKVYAIRPGGTIKWTYSPVSLGQPQAANIPSVDPAGNVYFAAWGTLFSLDGSGALRWKYDAPFQIAGSPSLDAARSRVLVGDLGGDLRALSMADGSVITTWTSLGGDDFANAPAIDGSGTAFCQEEMRDRVQVSARAVPRTTPGTWTFLIEGATGRFSPPALAADGTMYFGAGNRFYAVNGVILSKPKVPRVVRFGRAQTITGTIAPAHPRVRTLVSAYRKVGRRWSRVLVVKALNSGSGVRSTYTTRIRFTRRGQWYVRAEHTDALHGTNKSVQAYFSVR